MPERQVQKLIRQYDEEELQLESRISELESKQEEATPRKADINRLIALVRKYQNITELTDQMFYEFIDRVVVHAPNGAHGKGRCQQLNVYFNFVGNYLAPMQEISEEELAAEREAAEKARKRANSKRAQERQKSNLAALKEVAKTDPAAAAELEAYYEKKREKGRQDRAKAKAKREANLVYQAAQAEKAAKKAAREKLANLQKLTIAELEVLPESDPDYAAEYAEKAKMRNERASERRAELKKQAETDPEAAAKYEAMKAKERANMNRRNAEKRARAAVDSEYAAERKAELAERYKKEYA